MKGTEAYLALLNEAGAAGRARGFVFGNLLGFVVGYIQGKAEEARRVLLLLGRDQFGEPSADVQVALDALADVDRLEELTMRLKHAASWHELLGLPTPRRQSGRRKRSS